MKAADYVVMGGVALLAGVVAAVGSAVRLLAIGVDETIGLIERTRHA